MRRQPTAVAAHPATPDDIRWEERAAELAFNELPNLRAAAERWVASLSAVIGVFGVVLVVKGPSDISRIESDLGYVLAGILLAGAVAAALTAIIVGIFAAQGSPRNVETYSGPYIRTRYRREARTAARLLTCSRVAAIVAVVLLGAAIGTTWYGTPRTSTPFPAVATTHLS
ncbi:hypothetical protein AB0B31_25555 [Catellatospora citrea]|uniref:hypothetical protein n=1 Tax=Catellatospora citrea TaxID=53366 RepID=UPI0033F3DE2D